MLMTDPTETVTPHQAARAYAQRGWRVVPIAPGTKHPAGLSQWQKAATVDPDMVDNWWTNLYHKHGVGIATGEQSGVWVLDVDTHGADGLATLREMCTAHGNLPDTPRARTGSGGLHVFFAWDPAHPVRNLQGNARPLGPGIDIRGEGGQVVAAPTVHPNGTRYRWERHPDTVDVQAAPGWLYRLLEKADDPTPLPEVDSFTKALAPASTTDGDSIAEWANEQYQLAELLEQDGWTDMGGEKWCRPGKDPRLGHSAVLHDGQVLVVWSTEAADLITHGKRTADGSGVTVNTFGYLAATRHAGDRSACAKALREEHRRLHPAPVAVAMPETRISQDFWQARQHLAHIHQAAHSRFLAPDALLGAVLARIAYQTPNQLFLPDIVGPGGTLDAIHAIVGPSGAGKTKAMSAARHLLPPRPGDAIDGIPIGSGEGLIEAFYGMATIEDDNGKKIKERQQIHHAALFVIDEGQTLADIGSRHGSTLWANLRTAWSGQTIGQTNATAERTRLLKAGRYRFVMLIGIQPEKADAILGDAGGGTPQRFTWFAATDPTMPRQRPDWPGELNWRGPARPRTSNVWEMTAAASIRTEVEDASHAAATGNGDADPLNGHRYLATLKHAATLAVLDGRDAITVEDWELAGHIWECSTHVRNSIEATHRAIAADKHSQTVAAAADQAVDVQDAIEAKAILSMAGSIGRKVWANGTLKRRDADAACNSKHRQVASVDDAVDFAVVEGWVRAVEGALVPGPNEPPPSRRVTK